MNKNNVILFFILVLAFCLRLYKINTVPVSMFGDELDVGYHAYSILKTGRDYQGNFLPLHFHSIAEWRTPLYLYAAVPTVALFGISPLGVRLPAVIFGVISIWALYLVVKELLTYKLKDIPDFHPRALFAALILTLNPWHLQYSRGGFEVTMLLSFLLFGLYFFVRSLRENGRYLWVSVMFLAFTPWIYSTAKLFTPLLLIFLLINWRREIFGFPSKSNILAVLAGMIVGLPIAWSTLFGGGAERAAYTSVFTDEGVRAEVEKNRLEDIVYRGEAVLNGKSTLNEKLLHNKFTVWKDNITDNYLRSFSTDFLFINGDPNLRHSVGGMGTFFKTDALILIFGLVLFFAGKVDFRIKSFVAFLILAGALPSALTRDGGSHATRLILILPALVFLISYGLIGTYRLLSPNVKYLLLTTYFLLLTTNFYFYMHNYYSHYPRQSEKWWHAGMKEAITAVKENEDKYDRIILSMAGEPMYIFFAGWYEYPPDKWQSEYPINNKGMIEGFGEMSYIDKYYFGNFNEPGKGIYDLGNYLDNKTLYLATAKEVNVDLIREPERTPNNLKLIKEIAYPSGEPAYYLFTGR